VRRMIHQTDTRRRWTQALVGGVVLCLAAGASAVDLTDIPPPADQPADTPASSDDTKPDAAAPAADAPAAAPAN